MDPLALMPYTLAAAGGRVERYDTSQLVAAGLTLLQRSAPLVRALGARRAGLLLPPGPSWLVALSASDGRGAVLLDPAAAVTAEVTAGVLECGRVGAVFTVSDFARHLPPGTPHVLLDDAPFCARVVTQERDVVVDLGSHFALDLVGDMEGPGAPEECVVDAGGTSWSHASLKAAARDAMARFQFTPVDRVCTTVPWIPSAADSLPLVAACLAPLLAGAHVHPVHAATSDDGMGEEVFRVLHASDATMLVTDAPTLAMLVSHIETNGPPETPLKAVLSTSPCSDDLVRRAAICRLPLTQL